jgi:hypothetical protein
MPDITMCNGNYCELSSTCYRYKAEPSKYMQSYFIKEPNDGLECEYYWELECKYCHLKNGVHKISCPTNKIQINL